MNFDSRRAIARHSVKFNVRGKTVIIAQLRQTVPKGKKLMHCNLEIREYSSVGEGKVIAVYPNVVNLQQVSGP